MLLFGGGCDDDDGVVILVESLSLSILSFHGLFEGDIIGIGVCIEFVVGIFGVGGSDKRYHGLGFGVIIFCGDGVGGEVR